MKAWKKSDYLWRIYIINSLSDGLYNVYTSKKTVKESWDALDHKYNSEDARTKKFEVGQFLDHKMVDSKTISSQSEGTPSDLASNSYRGDDLE